MLDLDIAYPEFVPNQILTDGQLNQLRLHLEKEDRITRLRLAGMGIICGLVARKLATSIEIDAGYGITSDGDLIELCPTTTYTHFRLYTDPDKDEEDQLRYLPWRAGSPTEQRVIVELITPAQMAVVAPELPPQGATPLTAAHLANAGVDSKVAGRVLVLYLEHEPEELKSCLVTSCDNKGRNINVNVRALLVPRSADLTASNDCPAPPVLPRVPRFRPTSFADAAALNLAFTTIVGTNAPIVGPKIRELFLAHAKFLNLPRLLDVSANPIGPLNTGIAQYRYDALLDFVAAYNEAAAAVYALVKECCPTGAFPRHLMLGVLDGSAAPGFRNEFSSAPLGNVMLGEIDRVRGLFRRLFVMAEDDNLAAHPAEVGIVPSHTAAYPLGRRARPFYFPAMGDLWRPRPRCTVDGDWPWLNPAIPTGFDKDYAEATLLRIEGHVGKRVQAAYDAIIGKRHEGNAEFNVLRSYLDGGIAAETLERERMREFLRVNPAEVRSVVERFTQWVASGGVEVPAVHEFAGASEKKRIAAGELSRRWTTLRKRRHLHCDPSALEHDYLQARNRIICSMGRAFAILLRYQTDLNRLPDEKLTGPGLEASLEGAVFTLVRNLTASVVASPDQWRDPTRVKNQLQALGKPEGANALRAALVIAIQALRANAERLSGLLPRELADFDYELFVHVFRTLVAQSRAFWTWTRAFGLQIPGGTTNFNEGDAPLHPAEDASIAADWLGLEGCLLAGLAAIAAEYEAIRAADLSIFANLVAVDGLEHLAGVSKGGTFVLVSSDVTDTGTVLADLSLEGCLPCCCHVPDGVCLPPLALPDVRVVTIPPLSEQKKDDAFKLTFIDVNVMANDCDLNGPPPALKVGLFEPRSELGHALELTAPGVVRYIPKGRIVPGMVDSFEYELVQTSACEGRAIGTVVIVFAAKPVINGGIEGVVLDENNKPIAASTVTIIELGRDFDVTDNARFVFTDLPPGNYKLVARSHDGSATSDEEVVAVLPGQTTRDVRLILRRAVVAPPQRNGRIFVTVRDETAGVLPGVRVTALLDTEPPRNALTDTNGVAAFLNLKEGTYAIVAEMPGAVTQRHDQPVVLAADQTVAIVMTLRTRVIAVPPRIIETVATRRNVDVLTTGVEIRSSLQERYTKFATTFNKATRDPKITDSEAYKLGSVFLSKHLTDPALTDAEVAAQYKRTATALAAAVTAAPADPAKAAYRTVLVAVTAAYFDRIAAATPGALAPDQTAEVKGAATRMKGAGITADAFKERWQGAALKDRTGLDSADAIGALIT